MPCKPRPTPPGLLAAVVLMILCAGPMPASADETAPERARMIADIARVAGYASSETGSGAIDEQVMAVMARVPRHEFVPAGERSHAYAN
ncbi:MAG: protein-L-isoaspartate(D-aspartate) O-methyltransferase, partial [Gammaproteobacteria bacterium]